MLEFIESNPHSGEGNRFSLTAPLQAIESIHCTTEVQVRRLDCTELQIHERRQTGRDPGMK
jgi:hypothetical protein